jgi:hypothetical protein
LGPFGTITESARLAYDPAANSPTVFDKNW